MTSPSPTAARPADESDEPRLSLTREQFLERAATRRVVPVATRVLADGETPVGLYAHLAGRRPRTFLLESADSSGAFARWSFIGVDCVGALGVADSRPTWDGPALAGLDLDVAPLTALAGLLEMFATPDEDDLPPLHSGLVGYLGYDVVRWLEDLPETTVDDLSLPELTFLLVGSLAVLDHTTGEVWLIANAVNANGTPAGAEAAWEDAVGRVRGMLARLAEPRAALVSVPVEAPVPVVRDQRAPGEYRAAVAECISQIRQGEAFQIVASQRFDIATEADAFDVYRVLRRVNPSSHLYLLRMDGFDIVGASPEALVTVRDGHATTRPIAGTRPRGATAAEDAALERELLADAKEAAEHLMLVDLGRNDLGRVCEPGTVGVSEFMQVRRYSHVMHLEAAVEGTLRPGHTALSATLACFPAGTLSGAPKVSAMSIIDRVEVSRRGLYGGVVGYFDFAGNSDCAIAIRTAVLMDGVAHVQAGAGVVADSDPAAEDQESRDKAAALVHALRVAERWRPVPRCEGTGA